MASAEFSSLPFWHIGPWIISMQRKRRDIKVDVKNYPRICAAAGRIDFCQIFLSVCKCCWSSGIWFIICKKFLLAIRCQKIQEKKFWVSGTGWLVGVVVGKHEIVVQVLAPYRRRNIGCALTTTAKENQCCEKQHSTCQPSGGSRCIDNFPLIERCLHHRCCPCVCDSRLVLLLPVKLCAKFECCSTPHLAGVARFTHDFPTKSLRKFVDVMLVKCVVRRVAPRYRSREYLFVLFLFTFRLLLKLGLLLCCAMAVWLLLLLPLSTKCNLPSMALSYDRPRHDKIVKSILFIIFFVVLFFPNQNRAAWQWVSKRASEPAVRYVNDNRAKWSQLVYF